MLLFSLKKKKVKNTSRSCSPVQNIYKRHFSSRVYIHFSSKNQRPQHFSLLLRSSNSPLLTYLLRIHTHTRARNHETNVPRTSKIHIPQSYRSRARNYQSRTGNGELSRGNQSQLSARLPRRFHHRRTEREIARERERDEDDLRESPTLRVARNREKPRELETGWKLFENRFVQLFGAMDGGSSAYVGGLKPSHEGLPRVMRVGPESRISARRGTDAHNGLPDRLMHPGLRQTGITSVQPALLPDRGCSKLLRTSPGFSPLSVALEENQRITLKDGHTVVRPHRPEIFVKPRLHIEILSSSKNLLEGKRIEKMPGYGLVWGGCASVVLNLPGWKFGSWFRTNKKMKRNLTRRNRLDYIESFNRLRSRLRRTELFV